MDFYILTKQFCSKINQSNDFEMDYLLNVELMIICFITFRRIIRIFSGILRNYPDILISAEFPFAVLSCVS